MVTTVQVSDDTWERLNRRKEQGQSFDEVIQELLGDEPTAVADGGEEPINEIDRITDVHYIIKDCVVCGESHRHGAVDNLSVGETTERVGHCTTDTEYTGYKLKMTEDTIDERN